MNLTIFENASNLNVSNWKKYFDISIDAFVENTSKRNQVRCNKLLVIIECDYMNIWILKNKKTP